MKPVIALLFLICLAGNFLYPPWVAHYRRIPISEGYAFLFSPPSEYSCINWGVLAAQLLILATAAAIVFIIPKIQWNFIPKIQWKFANGLLKRFIYMNSAQDAAPGKSDGITHCRACGSEHKAGERICPECGESFN